MSFPTPPHLERLNKRKPNPIKPMNAVLNKLQEPSTIRGIIAIAAAFGMTIQPEYHEHIVAGCLALIGLISVWRKKAKIPKAEVVE
tara:strand:+ start:573 stop:830 length:258 start_codon:yes stop_codon:yes gene_type:complete